MEILEDDGTGNSDEGYPACNGPTGVEMHMPELMGQEVFEMEEITPQTEATGSLEPYRFDDGQDASFLVNPFDALYLPSTVLPATNHFTSSAPLTQTPLFPDASDDLAPYSWNTPTDMSYPPSFNDICNEAVGAVDKKSADVELDEEQLRWMEEVFLA